MAAFVDWENPYSACKGYWLRGNLHTHSAPASPCGHLPVHEVLAAYTRAGFDFLALSDHMTVTEITDAPLLLLAGMEWNSTDGQHTGVYACEGAKVALACKEVEQKELLLHLAGDDTLVILNHPNWQLRPHYRREELLAAKPYDGLEIYNGLIRRLDGFELATEQWDFLLSHGRRVWGFASDDAHEARDVGQAWMMVHAAEHTPAALLAAMKRGDCYGSTGVDINAIHRENDRITVETHNGQEIWVQGWGGRLLARADDHSLTFASDAGDSPYIRFTIYGRGSAMAWTQPFFIETEDSCRNNCCI